MLAHYKPVWDDSRTSRLPAAAMGRPVVWDRLLSDAETIEIEAMAHASRDLPCDATPLMLERDFTTLHKKLRRYRSHYLSTTQS